MAAPSRSVLALVLTHDAPAALDTCLAALAAQDRPPDAVLVVDNASSPPARPAPVALPVEVLRTDRNEGPAGGHAAGLAAFLTRPHSHAWVLDDDMIPRPPCLAELLAAQLEADSPASVVFPVIHDAADGQLRRWPAWCGPLLPRPVVERAGLPRAELVWWAEDTEYLQWRIPRLGIPTVWVDQAEVDHLRTRATSTTPGWKIYYEARNSVYVRLHVKRQLRHPGKLLRTLARLLARIVRREDHRWYKLGLFARGVADGVRGRLGPTVPLGSDARR